MKRLLVLFSVCVFLACVTFGCAWSVGGEKGRQVIAPPTQGQELIDLKRALDEGAINHAEYERQKRKVLER